MASRPIKIRGYIFQRNALIFQVYSVNTLGFIKNEGINLP